MYDFFVQYIVIISIKMLLRHHFLRDFVSALCATVGIRHLPHLCLRVPGLGFPKHRFRVTFAMPCEHPLLHLLYILSGVGNEAVKAERFRQRKDIQYTILRTIQGKPTVGKMVTQ